MKEYTVNIDTTKQHEDEKDLRRRVDHPSCHVTQLATLASGDTPRPFTAALGLSANHSPPRHVSVSHSNWLLLADCVLENKPYGSVGFLCDCVTRFHTHLHVVQSIIKKSGSTDK